MRKNYKFVIGIVIISYLFILCSSNKEVQVVVPNEIQKAWAEKEIGILIHFDMPVYQPDYVFRQWGTHPDPSIFNPTELDTDQWLETAQKLGATYAVLVAKHCSGFSLWPTEAHDYNISKSPWRNGEGDIVKDFIESCKKYGIKPGIYASTTANGYLHVDNPGLVKPTSPVTQEEYNNIVVTQLTELWTKYGDLFEIWFDGGVLSREKGGADILSLVQKYQPNAIAFQGPYGHPNLIRWVGNEEGVAPYPCWATTDSVTRADGTIIIDGLHGDPNAPFWCPGEADFTLRRNNSFQGGWFWHENQDDMIFPLEDLISKYESSVGRNTNMLLGLVIDNRGLVPDADVKMIEAYGKRIKELYDNPLKSMNGSGNTLSIKLNSKTSVDRIVLQEDITFGERILEFEIYGKLEGKWELLYTGSNIGNKHIARFNHVEIDAIKFEVKNSKSIPKIKNFSVYKKL